MYLRNKIFPQNSFQFVIFVPENMNYNKNICLYLKNMNLNLNKKKILYETRINYVTKNHNTYKIIIIEKNDI